MRLLQLKKYLRWFQSNLEYTSIALENTQKKQDLENTTFSITMVIEGF